MLGLVAALIVANLVLVATLWLKKEETTKPPQGDARDYLAKSLSMNEKQLQAFDELRKGHFERLRSYRQETRRLKDALFEQLKWPRNAQADTLAKKIGEVQTQIDLETFEHFSQLRELLTAEQAKKFDNTIQEVLRTMRPGGPPPGRRGEGPGFPQGPRPDGPPPGHRPDGPQPPHEPPH